MGSAKVNPRPRGPLSVYEAVTPYPTGASTVSRVAATASDYGYDGIIVRDPDPSFDPDAIADRYDIAVVPGFEITADDPAVIAGHLGDKRDDYPVIMVRGGNPTVNRYAVEEPRVDVLTAPMAGDGDINHVLAAAAARNNVRVEYRFAPVLRSQGGPRVQALSRLRKLREVLADSDAPFVVSADPHSHHHLRSGRDLAAVGAQIGFDTDTITAGLQEWETITTENRDRLDPTTVESGVHITDARDDDPVNDGDSR